MSRQMLGGRNEGPGRNYYVRKTTHYTVVEHDDGEGTEVEDGTQIPARAAEFQGSEHKKRISIQDDLFGGRSRRGGSGHPVDQRRYQGNPSERYGPSHGRSQGFRGSRGSSIFPSNFGVRRNFGHSSGPGFVSRNHSLYHYRYGPEMVLPILVGHSGPPKIKATDEMWEEGDKVVKNGRYTPASKALELLSGHTDPVLTEGDHEAISIVTKITHKSNKMPIKKDLPGKMSYKQQGLPVAKMKSACNEEAEKMVISFLNEFYKVYDSDNREALFGAYHENAVMSMSASYPNHASNMAAPGMKEYTIQSRNLRRIDCHLRRQKCLHQGRLGICAFLKDLPKTLHDPASFTLDIPFATDRLMTFTVTGIFNERENGDDAVRHFSRVFVVVPQGSGCSIVNDSLFITTPTMYQMKAFGTPSRAAMPYLITSPTEILTTSSETTFVEETWYDVDMLPV